MGDEKMKKKGQQMTLSTIIVIVLGIAVLVFLIFGFSTGWGNLWDKITQYGGGGANVDTVIKACAYACSSNSVDAFCRVSRTVNYGDGKWDKGSCYTFVKEKANVKIGIEPCGAINCAETEPELTNQSSAKT